MRAKAKVTVTAVCLTVSHFSLQGLEMSIINLGMYVE